MQTLKLIFLPFLFLVLFSDCSKEDLNNTVNLSVTGSWESTSVIFNGVEVLGVTVSAFTMSYTALDDVSGRALWVITEDDGTVNNLLFDYEIQSDGMKINIDGDLLDIDFVGTELLLNGVAGGDSYIIRAVR